MRCPSGRGMMHRTVQKNGHKLDRLWHWGSGNILPAHPGDSQEGSDALARSDMRQNCSGKRAKSQGLAANVSGTGANESSLLPRRLLPGAWGLGRVSDTGRQGMPLLGPNENGRKVTFLP